MDKVKYILSSMLFCVIFAGTLGLNAAFIYYAFKKSRYRYFLGVLALSTLFLMYVNKFVP